MRHLVLFVGTLLLASCDPVQSATFRLTPSPTARDSSGALPAEPDTVRANAITAVSRIAVRFGLTPPRRPSRCQRSWVLWGPDRTDEGQRHGSVHICVDALTDGTLQVSLAEGPPNGRWSVRADSLRQALVDTLGRFGGVTLAARAVPGTDR